MHSALGKLSGAWLVMVSTAVFVRAAPPTSDARSSKEAIEFFEKKIRPVLARHCYECHSGDPRKAKAHLSLDTRAGLRKGGDSGPVLAIGQPDNSRLMLALRHDGLEMPPEEKLPDEVIEDFARWIENRRTGSAF